MHGWVFVAGHEANKPHFLEDVIRRDSKRILGVDTVTLEMDHTVNVWNTPPHMHGTFDAVWLPDLGLPRNIITGEINGNAYPLPGGSEPIDWSYLFDAEEYSDEIRRRVLEELLKLLLPRGHLFLGKFINQGRLPEALELIRRVLPDSHMAEQLDVAYEGIPLDVVHIYPTPWLALGMTKSEYEEAIEIQRVTDYTQRLAY